MWNNKVRLKNSGIDITIVWRPSVTNRVPQHCTVRIPVFPFLSFSLSLGYYSPTYMLLFYTIMAQYLVKHNYLKRLIEHSPLSLHGVFISFLTQMKTVRGWVSSSIASASFPLLWSLQLSWLCDSSVNSDILGTQFAWKKLQNKNYISSSEAEFWKPLLKQHTECNNDSNSYIINYHIKSSQRCYLGWKNQVLEMSDLEVFHSALTLLLSSVCPVCKLDSIGNTVCVCN